MFNMLKLTAVVKAPQSRHKTETAGRDRGQARSERRRALMHHSDRGSQYTSEQFQRAHGRLVDGRGRRRRSRPLRTRIQRDNERDPCHFEKLHDATQKANDTSAVKEGLPKLGVEPANMTVQEFAKFFAVSRLRGNSPERPDQSGRKMKWALNDFEFLTEIGSASESKRSHRLTNALFLEMSAQPTPRGSQRQFKWRPSSWPP